MYADVEDPARWSLPAVLDEQARNCGDRPFVTMIGGDTLTYAQARDQAAQVASMLAGLGLVAGDRIAVMLPNGLDFVRAWNGIGRLGAIAVLLNTELTGPFLAHPLRDSAPRMLIVHSYYLARLESTDGLPAFDHIIVAGPSDPAGESTPVDFDDWQSAPMLSMPLPAPSDHACIMYTSGTTGAPKGVLMPHAHCYMFALGVIDHLELGLDDRYYICLPLFHANGLLMQLSGTMVAGARAFVRDRFSASSWLHDVRECGATVTNTLGAVSAFVIGQRPGPGDRDHALRAVLSAPNHSDHDRVWRDRFGIPDVIGAYGMTEVNIPLYGALGHARPGTCGRPYARYFDVEIRDADTDMPVPRGAVGEIMVRPRVPYAFMAEYQGLPEKTVEACRNFWFHTGDAARMDEDGYVTFVDRIKDCIRRRGENISATDIEASFADLPGIAEIAAFAVPSSILGGEDEIMLAIVRVEGAEISPTAIIEHARQRIPRFAQPRYLDFMSSLPKTGSEKVRKVELREAGVTLRTIDLVALEKVARA